MGEKTSYFEYIQKTYSFDELVESFNEREIICFKNVKQKVSADKLQALSLENDFNIKFFKSYRCDKYILLEGAKYLIALLRQYVSDKEYTYDYTKAKNLKERLIKNIKKDTDNVLISSETRIKITIVYSMKEQEFPREFYKRILDAYSVRVQNFLRDYSKENPNG